MGDRTVPFQAKTERQSNSVAMNDVGIPLKVVGYICILEEGDVVFPQVAESRTACLSKFSVDLNVQDMMPLRRLRKTLGDLPIFHSRVETYN